MNKFFKIIFPFLARILILLILLALLVFGSMAWLDNPILRYMVPVFLGIYFLLSIYGHESLLKPNLLPSLVWLVAMGLFLHLGFSIYFPHTGIEEYVLAFFALMSSSTTS